MRVTIEIPDQFVQHLVPAGCDPARSFLEASVAGAYREGRLTIEQVSQLLGLGAHTQAETFLQEHQSYPYTAEERERDLATLQRLLAADGR